MRRIILGILALFAPLSLFAQRNEAYLQYIETYKRLAVDHMQRHGVPASITLAQGILESNAGRSMLATKANNHFGIKVGSNWTGPYVLKDDDARNEKFRKYNTVVESYEDHSLFLKRPRYADLFRLSPTDYRGWAYGLKAAGYATNPSYPNLLIDLIEKYDLAQYDRGGGIGGSSDNAHTSPPNASQAVYTPRLVNGVAYVTAREGDTPKSIAYILGLKERKLCKYNEVRKDHTFHEGDIVFLGKKRKHVAEPLRHKYHRVSPGESMYSISQRYGIRLRKLYDWNNLSYMYAATPGDLLLLR